jgi:hypothetical protein
LNRGLGVESTSFYRVEGKNGEAKWRYFSIEVALAMLAYAYLRG